MNKKRYRWCADGIDIWDNYKEERIDYDFPILLNKQYEENKKLMQIVKNQSAIINELYTKTMEYEWRKKPTITLTKEDLEIMGKALSYYVRRE